MLNKTFRYRIKANRVTLSKADETLNLCRILYNLCLEQRINAWKYHKKSIFYNEQSKQLTELKKAFPEFNKVYSQTLGNVLRRLDKAYQNFFRRIKAGEKAGFPRFKSFNQYNSFTLESLSQGGWKLQGNKLFLSKIGKFKIILHRPVQGAIKTVIITKSSTNKWYVSFSCIDVPQKILPKTRKKVGIDVGCEKFLAASDKQGIKNPRFLKKSEEILKRKQQILSKKRKSSNRRKKAKLLVAKAYEHISNQRKDFHFKVANWLVKNYDTICIEKLKSWNSWKSLNKSMRDVSWFNFFNILRFKAEEAGKEVVEVEPKGTSQICSSCGVSVPKDLSVRIHHCLNCGLEIDRDINSAINILRLGMSLQGLIIPFPVKTCS